MTTRNKRMTERRRTNPNTEAYRPPSNKWREPLTSHWTLENGQLVRQWRIVPVRHAADSAT